jgi:hypothetical protein
MSKIDHAYVLVVVQPGKESEFQNEMSRKMPSGAKVEKIDFVHGSYDFIIMLSGPMEEINQKIMDMRKLPYVRKTETLIPFGALNWDNLPTRALDENAET